MDRPGPRVEGRIKPDGNGSGARSSGGGVERDAFFNTRVDPKMWVMERLGEITAE